MQSTHLREHNLSTILRAVVSSPSPLSRAALAKQTRLTKPTVSKLVEELIGAHLVQEDAPVRSGAGRPMVPLLPAMDTLAAIGIEVAADHVVCLAVDLAGRTLSRRTEYVSVTSATTEDAISCCARLIDQVRGEVGHLPIVGVVAAIPGRIAPDGDHVLSAPNLGWAQVPFVSLLREHPALADLSVRAQNDNRLSVLTELDQRPGESFIYIRGYTGVGGAVVIDGELLDGVHGWAGEFGHTVVQPGGARCRCGRRGCLEAYISYHSLRERAGLGDDVLIDELINALARSGDRADVIGTIGRSLGLAVANAMNVLDVSTVVLSGYLAPIAEEISPVVRETVDRHALAAEAGPITIERSDDLQDPALRGAARAALQPVLSAPGRWIERAARSHMDA